jgi:hypothetical protein
MTTRVWIDGWQLERCGNPFLVGDTVSWETVEPDNEWLAEVMGENEAGRITRAEEHHGEEHREVDHAVASVVTGVVTSIDAVVCRFAAPASGSVLCPVPGTARIEPRRAADVGNESSSSDLYVLGYVVDVE